MEIKKILWPTDFSAAAAVAESFVSSLTQQFDAEVHLIHVAEDLTQYEHYWGSGPDAKHVEELNEYAMKISRERLEQLCKDKLTGCPRYQIHIVKGDPAKEILNIINQVQPDLIVMATHGMKGNFPFGSVAERVVKNSPVPVLTINPSKRQAA
ncbi:MAG: universal stress protein [Desulforhabdus sp.]|jgi:nucleotide-binding universal stress UspA family protein|nr:universal stress protein [Desulforhabdus sp.]